MEVLTKIKEQMASFNEDKRGQVGFESVIGAIVILILIGIGQLVVTNVLTEAGVFAGLWSVTTTLWPVLAIVTMLAAMIGAFLMFRR